MIFSGQGEELESLFRENVESAYTGNDWENIQSQFQDSAYKCIKDAVLNQEYSGGYHTWILAQTVIPLFRTLSKSNLALYLDAGTHRKLDDLLVHGNVPLPEGLDVTSKAERRKPSKNENNPTIPWLDETLPAVKLREIIFL